MASKLRIGDYVRCPSAADKYGTIRITDVGRVYKLSGSKASVVWPVFPTDADVHDHGIKELKRVDPYPQVGDVWSGPNNLRLFRVRIHKMHDNSYSVEISTSGLSKSYKSCSICWLLSTAILVSRGEHPV